MFSIKLNDYMGEEQFSTNIGSPKGDVVSGINFIFNFENALKETRFERQAFKLAQDTSNNPSDDPPPSDRFYAGDAEFIDIKPYYAKWMQGNSTSILEKYDLHTNPEKTETTIPKRDAVKVNEKRRRFKKVNPLLGDEEDIINRKILSRAAFSRLE